LDVLFLIAMGQLQKTNVSARGFMFAGLSSHDLIIVMMHRHGIEASMHSHHSITHRRKLKASSTNKSSGSRTQHKH
jgi:hypothetical protein